MLGDIYLLNGTPIMRLDSLRHKAVRFGKTE